MPDRVVARLQSRAGAAWAWLLHGRVRLPAAIVGVAVLIAAVVVVVGLGGGGRQTALPPTPPAPVTSSSAPSTTTAAPSTARSSPTTHPSSTPRRSHRARCSRPESAGSGAAPLHLCIPAIGVNASIMQLGLNRDRTVEVPPLSRVGDAGWYRYSAAPGTVGPTVILGHVDSAEYGDGVFFHLGKLQPGDLVTVTRADGRVATFVITRLQEIAKRRFPTMAVYGPTSGPSIRLITCGGAFDAASGNYLDNIIAYGTLQSLRARA